MRLLVEAIRCGRKVAKDKQAGDPSIFLAVAPSESVLTLNRRVTRLVEQGIAPGSFEWYVVDEDRTPAATSQHPTSPLGACSRIGVPAKNEEPA